GGGGYAYRGARGWSGGYGYRGRGYAGAWNNHHHGYYRHGHYYPYGWYGPYLGYDYGYGYGNCYWLRQQAIITGSPYWWQRYNDCVYY
ncbi:MAG: hypothetical protein WB662_08040, partial [Methyloceanibacter sp.]